MPAGRVEILLVEDNPNDAELTLRALGGSDQPDRVYLVHDGAEALEFIFCTGTYAGRDIRCQPTVILLDLKLPKLNGLEVLRRLKSDPRTATIPVVVFTSSDHARDVAQSYGLGANSYVVKPVSLEPFSTAVRSIGSYWLDLNVPAMLSTAQGPEEEPREPRDPRAATRADS